VQLILSIKGTSCPFSYPDMNRNSVFDCNISVVSDAALMHRES